MQSIAQILECLLVESDSQLRELQRRVNAGDDSPRLRVAFRRAVIRADKGARRARQVADRIYDRLRRDLESQVPNQLPYGMEDQVDLIPLVRSYVEDVVAMRQQLIASLDDAYDNALTRPVPVDAARDMFDLIKKFARATHRRFFRLRKEVDEERAPGDDDSLDWIMNRITARGLPMLSVAHASLSRRVRPLAKALRSLDNHFGAEYSPESVKQLTAAIDAAAQFSTGLDSIINRVMEVYSELVSGLPSGAPPGYADTVRDGILQDVFEAVNQIDRRLLRIQRSVDKQVVSFEDLSELTVYMERAIFELEATDDQQDDYLVPLESGMLAFQQKQHKAYQKALKALVKISSRRGGRL